MYLLPLKRTDDSTDERTFSHRARDQDGIRKRGGVLGSDSECGLGRGPCNIAKGQTRKMGKGLD